MVLTNLAAAEALGDEIEDLTPFTVLADVELRQELPAEPCTAVAAHRYVKRAFSVDEPRDIRVQPFLLIVRTRHIVTVRLASDSASPTSSAGFSEFPAYSRIYRQRGIHCLATF